jgi:CPA2 family monovalent cation:H+ antiporter-2
MEHLPQLISDLALILLCAGVMTLLFKKLKQPVVLGYIVAGFLASPYMPYTPSVADSAEVSTWAEIGVIFLLFSLGLEFSFRKLLKAGSTPVIAVITSTACMTVVGILVGGLFGWSFMNGLYLGGMLAMSSTGIIVKAFDDLGLRQQKFASLVFSVLILEDIIAIVMMLLFGTLGSGGKVDGGELLMSMAKMVFYLILWFVLGIYLIPLLLRKARTLMNDETLLIVALAMCFLMVVLASLAGFSPAFGAFVMGSILAETIEAEHIENLVSPIKDLFAAVFFVSVGMMINPAMLAKYWLPIVVITLVVLVIRSIVGVFSFMLGGVDVRTSLQSSFSLAPVGEFSFIIATLGISLGAISDFIYPIIVSVSVITTFMTPTMIRLANPVADWIEPRMPERIKRALERYDAGSTTARDENKWKKMLSGMLTPMLVYGVLCIAILILSSKVLYPLMASLLPEQWAHLTTLAITLVVLSPFMRPLLLKHCFTPQFWELWNDRQFNRAPLLAFVLFRLAAVIVIIVVAVDQHYHASIAVLIGIIATLLIFMLFSRRLKNSQMALESTFLGNLNSKEEHSRSERPKYAGALLSRDLHLAEVVIPDRSAWGGKNLRQLEWRKHYDVNVASILRGTRRINIPPADMPLFPGDKVQIIGTDEQLRRFSAALNAERARIDALPPSTDKEMVLRQIAVTADSPLVGTSVLFSGIRKDDRCMVVGIDRGEDDLLKPVPELVFQEGDVVWVVGEDTQIRRLMQRTSVTRN